MNGQSEGTLRPSVRDSVGRHNIQPLGTDSAELVRRYARTDTEGYITAFQIFNDELVAAVLAGGAFLQYNLTSSERLSEHWKKPSPCGSCRSAERCAITCRDKHRFDKELYGGLLCGKLPCLYVTSFDGSRTDVYFKVRLEGDGLRFDRTVPQAFEPTSQIGPDTLLIDRAKIKLRPWSMALYMLFARYPEGLPLSAVYTSHRKEFAEIYHDVARSELKLAKLNRMFDDCTQMQRTINDKVSELNKELALQGVSEPFRVLSAKHKANLTPYFIRHLRDHRAATE